MKHSGFRFAVVVISLYAAFASFMFSILADESAYPGSVAVQVSGEKASVGSDSLSELLNGAAQEADAVILREVRDLHDPKVRHAYLSEAGSSRPEQSWLNEGYPTFSNSVSTIVHSASELTGVDPRGRYFVFGDDGAPGELIAQFERIGLDVKVSEIGFHLGEAFTWFLTGMIGSASYVVILLVILLVTVTTINNIKMYSIRQLNGMSKNQAIMDDLRRLIPFAVWVMVASIVSGTLGLFLYNGLNQFSSVLKVWFCIELIGVLLAIIVHMLAVHVVWSVDVLAGIKGKLGFSAASALAYLIRIPGLIVAISLVTSSFASAQVALESHEARQQLSKAGNAATILFGGSAALEEEDELAYSSGKWLKEQDSLGNLLVAVPLEVEGATGQLSTALLVNNSYIKESGLVSSDGKQISYVPPESVKVLLPDGLQLSQQEIADLLEIGGSFDPDYADNLIVETIPDEQDFSLYEPEPDGESRPQSLSDVPLILYGAQSDLVRDDDFMAFASQGRVLFKDFQTAVAVTPSQYLRSWIAAYIPIAQKAADEYSTRVMELRIRSVTALLSLVVLLATAVGMAQIHVRGNARLILVKYLHGWDFFNTHKKLFSFEVVLAGLVVFGIILNETIHYIGLAPADQSGRVHGQATAIDIWQPWAVLLVCLINIVVLVISLRSRTNILIRNRSEETA
ncbi:hypothetical protein M2368_002121 [Arthrobacter sp. JUb119]|uniref:hypothetical protein n=1 Tax=Micrococcaceae TaxID=1268 RepID=UPI001060AA00|nr:hypothetical protein [Arthrobacter sp. JUb115]MCS3493110.1 hypothetical protein [Arthrobacter sp. JUb119]